MKAHTRRVLEYDQFLELLAAYTCSASGGAAVLALRPAGDSTGIDDLAALISSFMTLRRHDVHLPRARFDCPSEILRRVRPIDAVLAADDFAVLSEFLGVAAEVHAFLSDRESATDQAVAELGEQVHDCPELRQRINRVFDDNHAVRDSASTKLQQIRRSLSNLEAHLRRQLETLLGNSDYNSVLQEKFIATRNDRFVVPVRRELKSRLPGVVHDQSNSGRTLFIEPQITVEAGNELATLRLQERDEIQRILAELSRHLRSQGEALQETANALCRYDLVFAGSHWAGDYQCNYPQQSQDLRLCNARHPLLQQQFRRDGQEDVLVPLDLTIPPDCNVMAITGSNTGGKTVALKTLGLLALIYQTGLPIPAEPGSQMPVFPQIIADIGDEQSLEQNLSTFSAHVVQIKNLLETARSQRTLALIDELGSGTDPVEGGALGCAVLDALAAAAGLTFVTTHLGIIKHHVHRQDAMVNASVQFNMESLQPEYVVQVGRPGASYALVIAERYEMPDDVLESAREMIGSETVALEGILEKLDNDQRRLSSAAAAANETLDSLRSEREELQGELTRLRKERKRLLHQSQKEAVTMVENTRRQMDRMLVQAKTSESRQEIKAVREDVARKGKRLAQSLAETQPRPEEPLRPEDLELGQFVRVETLNDSGCIVDLSDDRSRVTVEVAGKRFDVRSSQIGRSVQPQPPTEPVFNVRPPPPQQAEHELNLIGRTVDEAVAELESFLSRALITGLNEVRIVHGFGTGRLRRGLHDYLRGNQAVQQYRLGELGKDAGGGGVTIVSL